jgi:hypothetical protein
MIPFLFGKNSSNASVGEDVKVHDVPPDSRSEELVPGGLSFEEGAETALSPDFVPRSLQIRRAVWDDIWECLAAQC